MSDKEREEKLEKARANAKPGSLASKANMVKNFNENKVRGHIFMDYITVTAKNLDDAITEALVQLEVTSDRLDYEVIEKRKRWFPWIGRKQAVIKAAEKKSL